MDSVREQIVEYLDDLTDEQAASVLEYIESVRKTGYSVENDPMLNGELLFSGSPDLSERIEDILDQEFGVRRPHHQPHSHTST